MEKKSKLLLIAMIVAPVLAVLCFIANAKMKKLEAQ